MGLNYESQLKRKAMHGHAMQQDHIARSMAKRLGIGRKYARVFLNTMLATIMDELEEHGWIRLNGFGQFYISETQKYTYPTKDENGVAHKEPLGVLKKIIFLPTAAWKARLNGKVVQAYSVTMESILAENEGKRYRVWETATIGDGEDLPPLPDEETEAEIPEEEYYDEQEAERGEDG